MAILVDNDDKNGKIRDKQMETRVGGLKGQRLRQKTNDIIIIIKIIICL